MRSAILPWFCVLVAWQLAGEMVAAEDLKTGITTPNFNEHIKPILRQHCLKCHGEDNQEADLNLQAYPALLRGGSGGKIVEAGRSSQSVLFQVISTDDADLRMPPNSPPLPADKIALIARWIDSGLKETASSASMVERRDLTFTPSANAGAKPQGKPAMPEVLPAVDLPQVQRPLPILAMATSPWAPLLAAAGQNHIQIWNTETGKKLGEIAYPEGEPHVIRFSRDGAVLLVAGGRPVQSGQVVLFDVQTGKRMAVIGDELDVVLAADLSPDQQMVALGGSGRVVKVYSTIDGQLKYKIEKHTDWITALAFSPDGSRLATGDRAGGLHLWDATAGGILLNLPEHKAAIQGLDWRADSRLLASAGDDGSIIWWDTTDGFPAVNKTNAHPPQRPPGIFGTIPNGVLSCRFDQDGNLITTGRDGAVRLWNADGNARQSWQLEKGIPISCSISHDGRKAISGDTLGQIRFWEINK